MDFQRPVDQWRGSALKREALLESERPVYVPLGDSVGVVVLDATAVHCEAGVGDLDRGTRLSHTPSNLRLHVQSSGFGGGYADATGTEFGVQGVGRILKVVCAFSSETVGYGAVDFGYEPFNCSVSVISGKSEAGNMLSEVLDIGNPDKRQHIDWTTVRFRRRRGFGRVRREGRSVSHK